MSSYNSYECCKSCWPFCETDYDFNVLSEEELRTGAACLSVLQLTKCPSYRNRPKEVSFWREECSDIYELCKDVRVHDSYGRPENVYQQIGYGWTSDPGLIVGMKPVYRSLETEFTTTVVTSQILTTAQSTTGEREEELFSSAGKFDGYIIVVIVVLAMVVVATGSFNCFKKSKKSDEEDSLNTVTV